MCPDAQLQEKDVQEISSTLVLRMGEPLHIPRARVCVRPSPTACKVSFRSKKKPHLIKATPGHMHSNAKPEPAYVIIGCIAIAKASHLSPNHGLVLQCSIFGTGGVALHDVATRFVDSDSAAVRLERVLPSQLLARRTQGLTRFPPGNLNTISPSL